MFRLDRISCSLAHVCRRVSPQANPYTCKHESLPVCNQFVFELQTVTANDRRVYRSNQ